MGYPQIPLIDSDSLVYSACHACKPDEPVQNALHTIKLKMEAIIDAFDRGLEHKTYLTGSDNYRVALATILPYKGNRVQEKPIWYKEAREYLQYAFAAKVVDGQEADDAIGIEQFSHPDKSTCIVSIDKDMLTIPGYHFNWRTGEYKYVDNTEAHRFFWKQMITGDRTDNIQGLKGLGDKAASTALDGVQDVNKMRSIVERLYKENAAKSFPGRDWRECFVEMGRLLRIRRHEGEMFQ